MGWTCDLSTKWPAPVFLAEPAMRVAVVSAEIEHASLHVALPWLWRLYALPFLALYPLLAYAYFVQYDAWLASEEWTFLACTSLGLSHALSFLSTRWSAAARAWITTKKVFYCPRRRRRRPPCLTC
jgi:hypothetical protein